jgi:sterol 3beta-glucosyltransferase
LGLAPLSPAALVRRVRDLDTHVVYGYSRHLAPLPGTALAAALDSAVTGFWFLPHVPAWQPDATLAAFLAAGPPPIYVGFGSNLTGSTPDALSACYREALTRTGSRGIFFGGWGDFANIPLPPTMLRVASVPHDWLFARVAAVVHHGGAGSTSAAVAAGVPSVAMPFLGDQFFWARQLHALGCGPAPLVRQGLTTDHLTATISDLVANPLYRANARSLGTQLRAEHGAAAAAAWIESRLVPNTTGNGAGPAAAGHRWADSASAAEHTPAT